MKKRKKFFSFLFRFLTTSSLFFLLAKKTLAVCPLCAVAVGAGVEVSRFLGVDDTITGVWIGGLIVSLSFWLADYLVKKNFLKKKMAKIFSLFIFYLITLPFLFWGKLIGQPRNTFLGIDKILLGIIIGSLVFILAVDMDNYLRKINKGKVFIYYQKVLIPLFILAISSLILFFLTS